LNIRKLTSAHAHIAAGLPLTWVSEQKDAFKAYLLQMTAQISTFEAWTTMWSSPARTFFRKALLPLQKASRISGASIC
jgi:hypothetical protein